MPSRLAWVDLQSVLSRQDRRELDELFGTRSATGREVQELVMSIGALEGELRYVRLEAHLQTTALLTHEQILQYDMERGYGHNHDAHRPH